MTDDYIIAFSSFYKAAYAQEKLAESGFRTVAKRLPAELTRSCGYALTLRATPAQIQTVISVLECNDISHRGIYIEDKKKGKNKYTRIA